MQSRYLLNQKNNTLLWEEHLIPAIKNDDDDDEGDEEEDEEEDEELGLRYVRELSELGELS